MKRSRISKFGVVMAVLLLLGVTIARLHHRVIVSGQFLGLEIGATKEAVVRAISEGERFSYGELLYCKGVSVTRRNLRDLQKLMESEVVALSASRSIFEFEMKDGRVFKVREGIHHLDLGIQAGQTLTELESVLADVLRKDRYAVAYSLPYCVERFSSADLRFPEKRKFWEISDIWSLGENDRYARSRLFFVDNILVEIDFRNYFTELP